MADTKTNTAHIAVHQRQAGGGLTASHTPMKKIETIAPHMLQYLKQVADGKRPLSDAQLAEIRAGKTQTAEKVTTASVTLEASAVPTGTEAQQTPAVSNGKVGLDVLLEYMTSTASNCMAEPAEVPLDYPMSNYFISSSHNTYLMGHQLYGASSTEGYKNVLLRGCRCIEIDVWDGDEKKSDSEDDGEAHGIKGHIKNVFSRHKKSPSQDIKQEGEKSPTEDHMPARWTSSENRAEPRVLHGYTLTKEVSFRDVCEAIRETAFVANDLPVIASLEVHAGQEQQDIMVEIMKDSWRGMLALPPTNECEKLPSPADLRGKILVKVKAAPKEAPQPAKHVGDTLKPVSSSSSSSPSSSDNESEVRSSPKPESEKKKKKKSKIIQALSSLGIYTRSYHFKSLNAPEATIPTHVFSLSEKKLMEVNENSGPSLFSHNRNYLMRAYPSGTRVSSSNLDPAVFWTKGVQMVALNWQRFDSGVMLNEGQFAGTSGWVLKPEGYRGDSAGEQGKSGATAYKALGLKIEFLAAQDLPMPKEDSKPDKLRPYVKCELHVEPAQGRSRDVVGKTQKEESKEMKYKGHTKSSKGGDPDFGGHELQFSGISLVEELSFLRFKVKDEVRGRDNLVAWACIRLDRLQSGYRFVHLLDARGIESNGVLLVNIVRDTS